MSVRDAQVFLDETRAVVDAALDRWMPPADREPLRLHEAMRYALFAGGKRLRPALARAAAHACGGSDDDVLAACCALEMVHTYSLVHDDLPAIDDDDLRRGRPSCHKRFGEAVAVLAGDALQTHAFALLVRRTPRREAVPDLVLELAEAAGTDGMVGGELADIEAEGVEPDRALLESIHLRKTAALFRASTAMGGLAAGAGAEALAALRAYGEALGHAFQIVDDVLDETSDAATLGKSAGKDKKARKMSYPAVVGIEESRRLAQAQVDAALRALGALAPLGGAELLEALARFTVDRVQ